MYLKKKASVKDYYMDSVKCPEKGILKIISLFAILNHFWV
jgi:hypothetical protein